MEKQTYQKKHPHHNYLKLGISCIVLGLVFALETLSGSNLLYKLWPLIATIMGVGYIGIFHKRQCREGFFLGIGIYLILFSLLSLYCNFTSWQHLLFLWPLFISFLGISLISTVIFSHRNKLLLFLGFIVLSISIAFFGVFTINYRLWWIILILLGISILIVGSGRKR